MNTQRRKFLLAAVLFSISVIGANAQSVQYTDTAAMLSGYARSGQYVKYSDTANMLSNLLRKTDTVAMLTNYLKTSDTASMLSGYLRKNNGNFLALSGGTLTGALAGTSATFSGGMIVENVTVGAKASYTSTILGQTAGYSLPPHSTSPGPGGYFPDNTFVGFQSGYNATTGNRNSYFGSSTGGFGVGASRNTALGYGAGYSNVSGYQNTYVGYAAAYNGTGSYNTVLGSNASLPSNSQDYSLLITNGNGDHRIYSPASGNILLGSTSDNGSKFQVTGTGYFSGAVTGNSFVKTGGTAAQFLKADGSVDNSTYLTASSVSSSYLPLTGGTLSGAITGTTASFTGDINLQNGLTIGSKGSYRSTVIGLYAGNAMPPHNSTPDPGGYFPENTFVGFETGYAVTTGRRNAYFGNSAGFANVTGNNNTAVGYSAGFYNTGTQNTYLGYAAGYYSTGNYNTVIGVNAGLPSNSQDNSVLITDGQGNHRFYSPSSGNILLGSTSDNGSKLQVTGTGYFTGAVTGNSFVKTGGTSSQFLKADGSVDANTYLAIADTAAMLSGYVRQGNIPSTGVPYTGATSNLNMGNKTIQVGPGKWFGSGGLGGYDLSIGTEANQTLATNGSYLNITAQAYPGISFWRTGGITAGSISSTPSGRGNVATIAVVGDLSPAEAGVHDLGGTAAGLYRWKTVYAENGNYSNNISASSFIKSGGTSSQFLKADGSVDNNTYLTASALSSSYLPLTGGTLTGALAGTSASFSGGMTVENVTVGSKASYTSTILGQTAGNSLPPHSTTPGPGGYFPDNTFIGFQSGYNATTGNRNSYLGSGAGNFGVGASRNTALGYGAGYYNVSGYQNTYVGYAAAYNGTGSYNTVIGTNASLPSNSQDYSLLITNGNGEHRIYSPASGNILLGSTSDNGSKLQVAGAAYFTGAVTGNSFVKAGGTAAQFLKADGSVDNNTYLTTSSMPALDYLPLTGGTVTGAIVANSLSTTQTGSAVAISTTVLSKSVDLFQTLGSAAASAMVPASTGGPMQSYYDSASRRIIQLPSIGAGGGHLTYNNNNVSTYYDLRYSGTWDAKTPMSANVPSSQMFGGGWDGAKWFSYAGMSINSGNKAISTTNHGGRISFWTTAFDAIAPQPKIVFDENGAILKGTQTSPANPNIKDYTVGSVVATDSSTAKAFVKEGGTSSQFLKADGSVDNNTYLTASTLPAMDYLPLTGGTVTGAIVANSLSTTQSGGNVAISTTVLSKFVDRNERVGSAAASLITPAPAGGPIQSYYDSAARRMVYLTPIGSVGGNATYTNNNAGSYYSFRYNGTWDAKSPMAANVPSTQLYGGGWDGANWFSYAGINISSGNKAHSTTNHGGRISFGLTSLDALTSQIKIVFDENGAILKGTQTSPTNPNIKDYTVGSVYATDSSFAKAFIKDGGTASQFLKADGSVDANNYLTTGSAASTYLPLAGGTLTGTLNGLDANFNGTVRVKKVTVTPAGWSDYVFDKNYKLRTLDAVADFIKENKHLPDVPSAKEVAEKGINVGDNQATLLRKIEELTLYVIDLKREVNELKKEKQSKSRNGKNK